MCISFNNSITSQRFVSLDPQNRGESEKNFIMSAESLHAVDPVPSSTAFNQVIETTEDDISPHRRSILKNPNDNSPSEDKRVSFHNEVTVGRIPLDESDESIKHDVPGNDHVDDIDSLTQEVSNKLSKKYKDAPPPSLDDICRIMDSDDESENTPIDCDLPSTSNGLHRTYNRPAYQTANTFVRLPKPRKSFEKEYAEMDMFMRIHYPKYYHFLKSQTITGAVGSQEYRCQEMEFKEAIMMCKQYPSEFLMDVEDSLAFYESIATQSDNG